MNSLKSSGKTKDANKLSQEIILAKAATALCPEKLARCSLDVLQTNIGVLEKRSVYIPVSVHAAHLKASLEGLVETHAWEELYEAIRVWADPDDPSQYTLSRPHVWSLCASADTQAGDDGREAVKAALIEGIFGNSFSTLMKSGSGADLVPKGCELICNNYAKLLDEQGEKLGEVADWIVDTFGSPHVGPWWLSDALCLAPAAPQRRTSTMSCALRACAGRGKQSPLRSLSLRCGPLCGTVA